jgi:hypothetical protein
LEADFVEAHRALREAAPKKKQKKTNVKTEVGGRIPPVHELSQATVKKYIPLGSFIWQDRSSTSGGGWQCHFPPFKRVGRSFNKYGQAEALRLCLVELWEQYCLAQGIPREDCPMKGILDSVALEAEAPSACAVGRAASSSSAGR